MLCSGGGNLHIAALPSGEACDAAFNTVLSPAGNLTEAEYSAALQTFCSVDCGGSVVELTVTNCRSLEFAALFQLARIHGSAGQAQCPVPALLPYPLMSRPLFPSTLVSEGSTRQEFPLLVQH